MKLGFIVLAHTELGRVTELVEHLVENECAVVLHVDQRAPAVEFLKLQEKLVKYEGVSFARRVFCEWGSFSLVQAALNAASVMLEKYPELDHVALISGSCLPIRPVQQLKNFLSRHRDTDFIESNSVEGERWVKGGLNEERFTLYFPFSWRRHRNWFDFGVALQRKLGISRKIPSHLKPHIGSQWWCLTRNTLGAILNDEYRKENDQYFASSWIPDESYFQTLARKHSDKIESRSLTFSRFDALGKPFILYDDHLALMRKTDCFFMRKAWARADNLYQSLLRERQKNIPFSEIDPRAVESYFDAKIVARKVGGDGRISAGRFPSLERTQIPPTARPYTVFIGPSFIYRDFPNWLSKMTGTIVHGKLFGEDAIELANDASILAGNQTNNAKIRDGNPQCYLSNLIWNSRESVQSFQLNLDDNRQAMDIIFNDPNARVLLIKDAWLLRLLEMRTNGDGTLRQAIKLQNREFELIHANENKELNARVEILDLQDVLDNPMSCLNRCITSVGQKPDVLISNIPDLQDIKSLPGIVRRLRNQGMDLKTIELNIEKPAQKAEFPKPKLIS